MKLLNTALLAYLVTLVASQRKHRIISGNSKVTFDILENLGTKLENVVFSPTSVEQVMGMIFMGSSGNTANQIKQAIMLERFKDKACTRSRLVTQFLERLPEVTLATAKRLYVATRYPILENYQQSLSECFHVMAESMDFSLAQKAAGEINSWVLQTTHGKIENLISPASLSGDTHAVLVTGVSFNGSWENPFNKFRTEKAYFRTTAGINVDVEMMRQTQSFPYAEIGNKLNAQVLQLPYKGNDTVMMIILPYANNGLEETIQRLRYLSLGYVQSQLKSRAVDVILPKFRLEGDIDMKQPLIQMGITDLFTRDANLNLMTSAENLWLSNVIQKTFVDVDENGSEAPAATNTVRPVPGLSIHPPPVFKADHPFLFFILGRNTGLILFAGKLENPI